MAGGVAGGKSRAAEATSGSGRFGPLRVADTIAAALRERIVNGEIPNGELPKQEELLEQLGVSRQSLRAALGILEKEGLITIRRGNAGGAIVHSPNPESPAYPLGLVMQARRISIEDLAEALRLMEPMAASLLASHRDEEVLDRLRRLTDAAEAVVTDPAGFTRVAREFHKTIVAECGNETIGLVVGVLEKLWSEQIQQWADLVHEEGRFPDVSVCRSALSVHRKLLDAIAKHDATLAYRIARSHLDSSQFYLLSGARHRHVRATPVGFQPPRVDVGGNR